MKRKNHSKNYQVQIKVKKNLINLSCLIKLKSKQIENNNNNKTVFSILKKTKKYKTILVLELNFLFNLTTSFPKIIYYPKEEVKCN